jgi:hypothetical protein
MFSQISKLMKYPTKNVHYWKRYAKTALEVNNL